ncbi:hypothetical protein [Symbioplanes lichenis]|uniref:hypothetical protein n=1 Tax=Symbioplanes lichenis TaxID=1629072 RepID=UPI0027382DD9|nr:hypothetical protein [Actinoplanes lichenis]
MSEYQSSDLLKKVERYEAAVKELAAAHEEVKTVLIEAILFDRWQMLGAQLGFSTDATPAAGPAGDKEEPNRDLAQLNQQISQMSEAWAR